MSSHTPRWVRERRRLLRAYANYPPRVILGAGTSEFTPIVRSGQLMALPEQTVAFTRYKPRRRR